LVGAATATLTVQDFSDVSGLGNEPNAPEYRPGTDSSLHLRRFSSLVSLQAVKSVLVVGSGINVGNTLHPARALAKHLVSAGVPIQHIYIATSPFRPIPPHSWSAAYLIPKDLSGTPGVSRFG